MSDDEGEPGSSSTTENSEQESENEAESDSEAESAAGQTLALATNGNGHGNGHGNGTKQSQPEKEPDKEKSEDEQALAVGVGVGLGKKDERGRSTRRKKPRSQKMRALKEFQKQKTPRASEHSLPNGEIFEISSCPFTFFHNFCFLLVLLEFCTTRSRNAHPSVHVQVHYCTHFLIFGQISIQCHSRISAK